MFVSRLLLKNYRCFGPIPAVVEFSESGLTALIGPNNVGKSTVLKALEILLGDRWPSSAFNEDDFHLNNLREPIQLACSFTAPVTIDIYGQPTRVSGLLLTARHLETGYGESSVDTDFNLISEINDFENHDWELVTRYRGEPVRVSQAMKNALPVVVTVPLIKLGHEQPTNKWGVLGRMLQKVERRFGATAGADQEFKDKIKAAVDVLRRPEEFADLERDIRELWEATRPVNLGDTSLEFLDAEPWRYYRQFRLAIRKGDQDVPIDTLGEGVQRLAVIALYRAYLRRHGRNERAILLIEEPESYLHPQARRTLYRVLREAIAGVGEIEGQIIYTTHSEDFIDCGNFRDIAVFSCTGEVVSVRRVTPDQAVRHTLALNHYTATPRDPHIFFRLLETVTQGLKEALFAHRALIVEGPTDFELFGLLSAADRSQIAIVSAGTKSTVPAVHCLLTAFGVPCLVAIDGDVHNDPDNRRIVESLTQCNAQWSDETKLEVTVADIESVGEGKLWTRGRLLVFARNVEGVLERHLADYTGLASTLARVSDFPQASKPRLMRALGLAYRGEYTDGEVLSAIAREKEALDGLAQELNTFLSQRLERPELLNPPAGRPLIRPTPSARSEAELPEPPVPSPEP